MKRLVVLLFLLPAIASSQTLKLKKRKTSLPGGARFASSISDTALTQQQRERRIFKTIQAGNVPSFMRRLAEITDTIHIEGQTHTIRYYVLPDYLAIGSDNDYFYCPMTPALAQKVADHLKCSLPTRRISNRIYELADVRMIPEPIPPSRAMTTVSVFRKHNEMIQAQRRLTIVRYPPGSLVAGNKKDVVVSNKIFQDGKPRVVIYGWHRNDGSPIQPLYNGHSPDWADYSHGIRLIQKKVWVNGRKTTFKKVITSSKWHLLLSDEGFIRFPAYPKTIFK